MIDADQFGAFWYWRFGDVATLVGTTTLGVLANVPWIPVTTLVLIPLARWVGLQFENRSKVKKLDAEVADLKLKLVEALVKIGRIEGKNRASTD